MICIPARFDDPEFKSAVNRILEACKSAGKYAFIFTGSTQAAKKYIQDGFDGVAIGTDVSMYINAYKLMMEDLA